jgi:SSS family transporter
MVYLVGVLVGILIFILVGLVLSKRIANVEDYYVSGRNAPTVLITGSLVASFLSSVTFMGEAGFSYDGYPIIQLILVIFNASGYVFGVFLFGRFLRRSNALTVPEYFGKRFNSKKIQRAAGITTIIGISAYIVAVTMGGALLFSSVSGFSYTVSLIIIWFAYTSFTFLSGAKGVLVNDTLMFFIFLFATVVALPFILNVTGGWPNAIIEAASTPGKEGILDWHGIVGENAYFSTPAEALIWAVVLGLVWGTIVSVSPWQTSRYLMAKSEHVVIRSGIIGMISIMVIYLILHISMTTVNNINPNITPSENVFIWTAINVMPTWLGILILLGIMSAVLSSCSTFLQLIGNSVSNDIFINKQNSDKSLLRFSRIVMLLSSIVILIFTFWQPPAVMWIGYFAATLFAASWGPVAFASIFSKKINKEAAFWSIIVGFAAVLVCEIIQKFWFSFPIYFHPVIIGVVLSTLILFVGSKFGEVTEEERLFQQQLWKAPDDLADPKEMVITKRYPNILIFGGAVVIVLTFILYYIPLNLL